MDQLGVRLFHLQNMLYGIILKSVCSQDNEQDVKALGCHTFIVEEASQAYMIV